MARPRTKSVAPKPREHGGFARCSDVALLAAAAPRGWGRLSLAELLAKCPVASALPMELRTEHELLTPHLRLELPAGTSDEVAQRLMHSLEWATSMHVLLSQGGSAACVFCGACSHVGMARKLINALTKGLLSQALTKF